MVASLWEAVLERFRPFFRCRMASDPEL